MSYLKPAQRQNGKFLNPVPTHFTSASDMLRILPDFFFGGRRREPNPPLPHFVTSPAQFDLPVTSGLRITWFGHSSLLLEIDGFRLLVDPVWSDRASPVQFAGPKRFFPPTIALADLPPLDAVLVSHDHYDHLDETAVRGLASRNIRWITSLGVGKYLQEFGVPSAKIHEMNWTESLQLTSLRNGSSLQITSLPSRHFSGRSLFNRFGTLWASFVLKSSHHNLYFGADSGEWPGFAEIGQAYGPFDLTMLEIGASDPLWESIHLGPDRASEAHLALRGKVMFPIHWGLFDLALHEWRQPIERLLEISSKKGIELWMPSPGNPTEFWGEGLQNTWWRQSAMAVQQEMPHLIPAKVDETVVNLSVNQRKDLYFCGNRGKNRELEETHSCHPLPRSRSEK